MIFAANSAFANRSSACGRFRSANTFPELGVDSRLGIFLLLTSQPACAQAGAAAGSDPIHAAEWRCHALLSSGKHEARKPLPRTVQRTPHDRSHADRPHAPAKPFLRSCATSSLFHASARSALGTRRNRASAEPRAESPSADQASRQAKPAYAGVPAFPALLHSLYAK